jgi:hypothetical protein
MSVVSTVLSILFIKPNMPERTFAPNSIPDQPEERAVSPFQSNPLQNMKVIPLSPF